MILLQYIVKLFLCSGLLFLYYWLFLRNKAFHRYNRFFLLATVLLSLVFPFLNIAFFVDASDVEKPIFIHALQTISVNHWETEQLTVSKNNLSISNFVSLQNGLLLLYSTMVLILLVVLIRSLLYIKRIRKDYTSKQLGDLRLYTTTEPGTPFSFFKSIFWNSKIGFNSKDGQQIFRHELFHVRQQHSLDNLFMEIVICLAWFNPFFYLIKKEIKAIHEFLADQYAVSGSDRYAYAELLVMESIRTKQHSITHPFFNTQIKRRIAMITQFKNKKYGYWSRVMALPIILIIFSIIALKAQQKDASINVGKTEIITSKYPITVVIDAAHGGEQSGVLSEDKKFAEKDFTLTIAKKIEQLSPAYNVNVIMTREEDRSYSYEERARKVKNKPHDLLISIHINGAASVKENSSYRPNTLSGFEVYITGKNKPMINPSKPLASSLLNFFKEIYFTNPVIKQRLSKGIAILDQSEVPSALVECGYMTNKGDLDFISDNLNIDAIANKMLEGIVSFSNQSKEKKKKEVSIISVENPLEKEPKDDRKNVSYDKNNLPDSLRYYILRHFIKNLRYPEEAAKVNIEGTVFLSVLMDTKGNFSQFKTYKKDPDNTGAKTTEIVVSALTTDPELPIQNNNPHFMPYFSKEAERITNKYQAPASIKESFKPGIQFFKISFKLEHTEAHKNFQNSLDTIRLDPEALKQRFENIFNKYPRTQFSSSSGKIYVRIKGDSIVYTTSLQGFIDFSNKNKTVKPQMKKEKRTVYLPKESSDEKLKQMIDVINTKEPE